MRRAKLFTSRSAAAGSRPAVWNAAARSAASCQPLKVIRGESEDVGLVLCSRILMGQS
jgi:hypothetical protein